MLLYCLHVIYIPVVCDIRLCKFPFLPFRGHHIQLEDSDVNIQDSVYGMILFQISHT